MSDLQYVLNPQCGQRDYIIFADDGREMQFITRYPTPEDRVVVLKVSLEPMTLVNEPTISPEKVK